MTLHIDYPTELCFLLIDAIRDRTWRQPEHDFRLKIVSDESGRCALEVVCAPGRLNNRRVLLKIFDHEVVVTFAWTPKPNSAGREGWGVGECKAFWKLPRPALADCDAFIERFWTHLLEHSDETLTY